VLFGWRHHFFSAVPVPSACSGRHSTKVRALVTVNALPHTALGNVNTLRMAQRVAPGLPISLAQQAPRWAKVKQLVAVTYLNRAHTTAGDRCASYHGHAPLPQPVPRLPLDARVQRQQSPHFLGLRVIPAVFPGIPAHFPLAVFSLRAGGPRPRFPASNRHRLPLPSFPTPPVHQGSPPIVCLPLPPDFFQFRPARCSPAD